MDNGESTGRELVGKGRGGESNSRFTKIEQVSQLGGSGKWIGRRNGYSKR